LGRHAADVADHLMRDAGGNQREMDRAKAAKKQATLNKSKAKESNTSLAKRKEAYVSPCHIFSATTSHILSSDAEILRAKQKA